MSMEQAKWYRICFDPLIRRGKWMCPNFLRWVLIYQLKEDGVKRISTDIIGYEFHIFCGLKKLNKLIEEAHLLGLEDELLIFERRA